MKQIDGETIGIDLGTTYSCVGVWQDERVEIIANDQGNRTTPSWVAFNETEKLVGESAKNQFNLNPNHTIFDIKRFMGQKFNDKEVQNELSAKRQTMRGQFVGLMYCVLSMNQRRPQLPMVWISIVILRKILLFMMLVEER
jgi:molecular chaperone DnaK (HSP70)